MIVKPYSVKKENVIKHLVHNDFALAAVAGLVETNRSTKYKITMIIKSYN